MSILIDVTIDRRENELMACRAWRVHRVTKQLLCQGSSGAKGSVKLQVGDWVLFAHGQSLGSAVKCPALVSK